MTTSDEAALNEARAEAYDYGWRNGTASARGGVPLVDANGKTIRHAPLNPYRGSQMPEPPGIPCLMCGALIAGGRRVQHEAWHKQELPYQQREDNDVI